MDPLSVATSASGLAAKCAKLLDIMHSRIDTRRDTDTNFRRFCYELRSLSRGFDAIGKIAEENPTPNGPGSEKIAQLWASLQAAMNSYQPTLDKLEERLEETPPNATPFGLSILRRPAKQAKLNLKPKEIEVYRERFQQYNGAMQVTLQLISTLILARSTESTDLKSTRLREQIDRTQQIVNLENRNKRLLQDLAEEAYQADTLHSETSSITESIVSIQDGSVLGDSLSQKQWESIDDWIPPPISGEIPSEARKEMPPPTASASSSTEQPSAVRGSPSSFTADVIAEQSGSDSDSEMEREMTKKFKELALGSFQRQDLGKAEKLLGIVISRAIKMAKKGGPLDLDLKTFEVRLAVVYCLQGRWKEAESILLPMATSKGVGTIEAFHGMHALALKYMREENYTTAIRHCKRAISGKRRILGKDHVSLYDSISLLALIFERAGKLAEAEAYRSFLCDSFPDLPPNSEDEPSRYIEQNFGLDELSARDQKGERASSPKTSHEKLNATNSLTHAISASHMKPLASPTKSSDKAEERSEKLRELQAPEQPLTPPLSHKASLEVKDPQNPQLNSPRESSSKRTDTTFFVGIDFGKFNTAVAVGFANDSIFNKGNITQWPTSNDQAMPSEQSQHPRGLDSGIANVVAPTGYPKDGVKKTEWAVLDTMASGNTLMDNMHFPPLPPGKNEIDAIATFLLQLREAIEDRLASFKKQRHIYLEGCLHQAYSLKYIITIPAAFNNTSKAAIRAAAIKAGFLRREYQDRLSFISSPQAALLSFSRSGAVNLHFQAIVLVIHCGSGIVQLASYQVPTETSVPEEYTSPTGDACGGSNVNKTFGYLIRPRMRMMKLPDGSKTMGKAYAHCILNFQRWIRYAFDDDGRSWEVDVQIPADFPDAGIKGGRITFSGEEILACFTPAVQRIRELIDGQVAAIGAKSQGQGNDKLKSVVLSGDFSQSEYLFQCVKNHFSKIGVPAKVVRGSATEAIMAAANGAVLAGAVLAGATTSTSPSQVDIKPLRTWLGVADDESRGF